MSLTLAGADEQLAATGDLDVGTSSSGTTAGLLRISDGTIDITAADRVLHLQHGESLRLSDVNVTGGDATTTGSPNGGGIITDDESPLFMEAGALTGNKGDRGGGLQDRGTLTLSGVTVADNSATGPGGGRLQWSRDRHELDVHREPRRERRRGLLPRQRRQPRDQRHPGRGQLGR